VNVLLVGLGRWGEKHLRVLRELGATVWAADLSAARRRWAVEHGVAENRCVSDYRQALSHVDAVDIVTPADSHLVIANACLEAGRHCFIEKPLAMTVAEGSRIVERMDATQRIVQVGHIFRFHPVTAALREVLRDGNLGRVRYATGRFAGFKRPRTDVGVTHTDAIHYFDLFAHLFACDATTVGALQRDFLGRGLDDMSVTSVTYGDIVTIVEANYFVPGTYRECVIVAEGGTLVADYGASTVHLYAGQHVRRSDGWEAVETGKQELPIGRDEPLRAELAAFLAACAGESACAVDARVGLRALEIVEAAALSARLARVVTLDELRKASSGLLTDCGAPN
jgi:predicted dehydrogenase